MLTFESSDMAISIISQVFPFLSCSTTSGRIALQVGRSQDRFPVSPVIFPWHPAVQCALVQLSL